MRRMIWKAAVMTIVALAVAPSLVGASEYHSASHYRCVSESAVWCR